jgi:mannose-6-phosphate isomerase-like protein (cupin superfamily)
LIRNRENVEPYETKDKSTIRELYNPDNAPVEGFSVAEAEVGTGAETEAHLHKTSQEVYYVIEGTGTVWLDNQPFEVKTGDSLLITPGTPHKIKAGENGIRVLCICSPAYSHHDTELLGQ